MACSQIEQVASALDVPVIAKEVGSGFGAPARVGWSSPASAPSTWPASAARVGRVDASQTSARAIAWRAFADWGIPTPEAIRQLRAALPASRIGSGGLRNGIDVAKAIALGADLGRRGAAYARPGPRPGQGAARRR